MSKVRRPAVSGQFYPDDPGELQKTIRGCLEGVQLPEHTEGTVVGAVAPHAGYVYSGSTAAYTYSAIAHTRASCVILLGPSHRDYFEQICVYDGDAYETPLGEVAVDTVLSGEIGRVGGGVIMGDIGHRMEHALEVQVPFLQMVLPDVKIVPITMGTQKQHDCEQFAGLLAEVLADRSSVIVASSDLSHFHPYETAIAIDAQSADLIRAFDGGAFLSALEEGTIEACGGGPVGVTMLAARTMGASTAHVLHSCNSGDVSGDRSGVVGYLSAVFSKAA